MERNQKTHRPSDFRGGRIQPLFVASPAQSTNVSQESAVSSSFAHNAQDRPRTHRAKRKGKDHDSEGIGHRLLDMMRKTLTVSENKEMDAAPERSTLVPFGDVVGCLAVHIQSCRHFLPMIYLKHYTNLYIRISVNSFVKYTKSFSLLSGNNEKNIVIKFDEMKFFSIQVPRHQDDKRNNISLELVQYSDTENYLLLLGSAEVHLYEVIQCVCRLDVELMFAYGSFGYGFSHQLKPLQRNIEPTMFLNVASHPKRKDLPINIVTPQPVTVENSADRQHPNQPPIVQLENPRERLEKMKKEYRNLSTWKEKADYLESILNPELEHKNSKETNINKMSESLNNNQYEKKSEDTITLDVPLRSSEGEITPVELLENDKKDLTIPTLNLWDQDNSIAVIPRIDESTLPPTDIPLSIIPTLKVTEEGKIPPLDEQSKAILKDKMKDTLLPPVVRLRNTHPNILKTDSSSAKIPKFTNKASFDPILRTIDDKLSARSSKGQDMYKNRYILLAEDIEYEDQDPPYPAFSNAAGYPNNTWAPDPNIITKTTSDIKKVLKRENTKLKVQKERKCAGKSKKLSNCTGRLLPPALPTTAICLRKSIPKTWLHWTPRTTIHDCLDKYEDLYVNPVKHPTKTKSRARLVGKNPDDSHNQGKHVARPYTAPDPNKQQESYTRKFPSPRMVSAGLIHINDSTLDHTMNKMWPPQN
ncbi:C2 calcium-dependent domain-containing protein 6 isoform X2 [Heterocephalus glaber]|uniref:C2 calcium-dependent domain-containing protein 6 isoform X2 n=1 Tax=Heterocephalus glaber TaxID=10181 RepID=A0AAX6RA04_HETGA|nr:C2 calcium-dependent domain-containing protein 6 isoform X2 [Heterocephalus glaber]